ncbi:MAG: UDP-N-acetylmuramate dehydrogenase [Vicinamibacterales bacterium]
MTAVGTALPEGFLRALLDAFGPHVSLNTALGPRTTFRVGGPADALLETRSSADIVTALKLARAHGVPVTILGGGSNVLVSDEGVRGLVIHPKFGDITSDGHTVRADAAVSINGLVRWTVGRGLAGLEAWAGTPGSVGGGIYGNAHFRGRLLSEHVAQVGLATRDGVETIADVASMTFGYDRSRLQESGEVLLWADFRVSTGDPASLRSQARASLAYRKATQPLHLASAGCIFQNPAESDTVPDDMPRSAGALIDRAGLKGARIGKAEVSTLHANFIVNPGGATAADVKHLLERCRREVRERFGVTLREEIVYLGDFSYCAERPALETSGGGHRPASSGPPPTR